MDSGPKTIQATVTDATGATAEASVDVYVILEVYGDGRVLAGGKTYRLYGGLITVPEGLDLYLDGIYAGDDGGITFGLGVRGQPDAGIFLYTSDLSEAGRLLPPTGADGASGSDVDLDAKFDELVDSVGRLPRVVGDTP